ELDPHLIFYLNGPTSDTNRFDPEILLQHRRRAPINSALSLDLDLHWTSLTMQAQVSLHCPLVGSQPLYLAGPEADLRKLLCLEYLGAQHGRLNFRAILVRNLRIDDPQLPRVHRQFDRWVCLLKHPKCNGRSDFMVMRKCRKKPRLV